MDFEKKKKKKIEKKKKKKRKKKEKKKKKKDWRIRKKKYEIVRLQNNKKITWRWNNWQSQNFFESEKAKAIMSQ